MLAKNVGGCRLALVKPRMTQNVEKEWKKHSVEKSIRDISEPMKLRKSTSRQDIKKKSIKSKGSKHNDKEQNVSTYVLPEDMTEDELAQATEDYLRSHPVKEDHEEEEQVLKRKSEEAAVQKGKVSWNA